MIPPSLEAVRARVRDVPDFPQKGVVFKDITPVLADPALFRTVIDALADRWRGTAIDRIVGIESRGFLFAAPLAYALGAGVTVVRKPGKLPWHVIREVYALEYGENALELHVDAVQPVDDRPGLQRADDMEFAAQAGLEESLHDVGGMLALDLKYCAKFFVK